MVTEALLAPPSMHRVWVTGSRHRPTVRSALEEHWDVAERDATAELADTASSQAAVSAAATKILKTEKGDKKVKESAKTR